MAAFSASPYGPHDESKKRLSLSEISRQSEEVELEAIQEAKEQGPKQ